MHADIMIQIKESIGFYPRSSAYIGGQIKKDF